MKKFFLLLLISMSFIACSTQTEAITTEAFIEDLNSFDSTAIYNAMQPSIGGCAFVISYKDSLFYYNVEMSDVVRAIYIAKEPGDKVK